RDPLEIAYERIEEGMPTTEARAIVGRPETTGGFTGQGTFYEWFGFDDKHELRCKLTICSVDDRVVEKNYKSYRGTLRDRLRRCVWEKNEKKKARPRGGEEKPADPKTGN